MLNNSGSTPPTELEADFFSGYVMAKMGATLNEAKAAMSKIASNEASASHPGKSDRLNAIARGWNSASGTTSAPSNPQPQTQPNQPQTQYPAETDNDASWIHLNVYGSSNMTVYLSDDGRKFVPAQLKTDQPFVFKYDVYDYGWMRFGNNGNSRTYKLYHGRDYAIVWSRRANSWTVVEVQ
jgi:hypothetical protein